MEEYENERNTRKMRATEEQRRASDPQQSVWVEASAGTGKTTVLTDRVLRLLLDNDNPRLLCLTYTKAAAVEMNSRISKRLSEWAVKDDATLEKDLTKLLGNEIISDSSRYQQYKKKARTLFAKLLDSPDNIKIQTIHSFCTDVLKRFPLEAGISPYFEVLEDEESDNALAQIKTEILLKENHGKDKDLAAAIDYFAENLSETTFPQMLKKITEKRREMVKIIEDHKDLSGFITDVATKLEINPNETEESIKGDFMRDLKDNRQDDVKKNMLAWSHGKESDKKKAETLAEVIENGFLTQDYDEYKFCYFSKSSNSLSKSWYLATNDAKNFDAELWSRLEDEGKLLDATEQRLKKLRLFLSTKAAFTIVREIDSRYEKYKHAKSCMDFDDLIYKTQALLKDSSARQWVLYKLDGGIDHILVDEAQDTSPAQWEIIAHLCEDFFSGESAAAQNRTIFVVGDRKQSIFSFQGADPSKFDDMLKKFKEKAENAHKKFTTVDLMYSFRSAPAVLEAVDTIFANEQAADGVVLSGKKLHHEPVRAGEYGKVTILPLLETEKTEKDKKSEKVEDWQPPKERENKTAVETKMARAIASRIRKMVDESAQTEKPLHYRDFMILVRTRNAFVPEFIRACEKEHVPISGADRIKLSEEIAVQDLISLGKFLLYPKDSLSLAEVLTSPLFTIDEQLLEDLCYKREKGEELWDRIKASSDERCRKIFGELDTLLKNLDHIRPYEMFNFVLTKMNGRRKFIERMGQEVEDTLDEFINMTIDFEQRQIPSLRGFITWFGQSEKEIKREGDEAETNAVRLLTVHHSKGLQAPIVFLPDTSKTPSDKREQKLLCDEELAYYPLNAAAYDDICTQIKDKNRLKEMEEYRRLLYVALTRAEDQLYICAHGKDKEDAWHALCRQSLKLATEKENGEIVHETPEYVKKEEKKNPFLNLGNFELPKWVDENITGQENDLAKPYTPSKDDDTEEKPDSISPLKNNGFYYKRGILIHRLLQFLPPEAQNKEAILDAYLQKNATEFSAEDCAKIKREVIDLLNTAEFADIFGADSRAEVPVVGVVGNKIISAQIDRLIVLPDKIKIVDFKTNQPPAKDVEHTAKQYIKQLAAYAKLMQKVYPDKPIETYILWTNETRLMRVA